MVNSDRPEEKSKVVEIDFDIFDQQVDEEIDKLFAHPAEAVSRTTGVEPMKPEHGAVKPGVDGFPLDQVGKKSPTVPQRPDAGDGISGLNPPSREVESATTSARASAGKVADPRFMVPEEQASRQELQSLLESLSVAYLSFEWEISKENLAQLEQALMRIEPHCQKRQEAVSLLRILRTLLHRLKTLSSSATPQVAEMVRESHLLLHRILLNPAGASLQDRRDLHGLVHRLRSLKGQPGPPPAEIETSRGSPGVSGGANEPLVSPAAPVRLMEKAGDGPPSAAELGNWMKSWLLGLGEHRKQAEEDGRRVAKIIEILDKVPALKTISSHLLKVRNNLEKQVLFLREKEGEWRTFMEQILCQGESGLPLVMEDRPESEDSSSHEGIVTPMSVSREGSGETPRRTLDTRQDQLCMFRIGGKPFALLASHLVKLQKVSARKVKKIRRHGGAVLKDFKDFWGNSRKGLIGGWKDLPGKVLHGFRFLPLPQDSLGVGTGPAEGTVLLLSNGSEHGFLIVDSAGIEVRTEEFTPVWATEGRLGRIEQGTKDTVEVIDVDWLLKKTCAC